MNALPFVILALVLSLGTQPPAKKDPAPPSPPPKPLPQPQPKLDSVVDVEIVVGTQDQLVKLCSAPGIPPSAIFISTTSKQVFHCVGNKMFNHADHGKEPALEKAVVRANASQTVRWFSKTNRFIVTSVVRHEVPGSPPPKKNAAPDYPFTAPLPKDYRNEVASVVRDEPGTVVQRYKATFNIEKIGVFDPDMICSM